MPVAVEMRFDATLEQYDRAEVGVPQPEMTFHEVHSYLSGPGLAG